MHTKRTLRIGWLYPTKMNIYGDRGNVIVLSQRAAWRGIVPEVIDLDIGDPIPDDIDVFFFGGGQDQEQIAVSKDLAGRKAEQLRTAIENGAAALTVCGGYQLFGHAYRPNDAPPLPGTGIFDVETVAGHERFIGNVVTESQWGALIGFENHSGLTWLGDNVEPMGRVVHGRGNNGADGTEGAKHRNALGCYLHGSILPKNPILADWLIARGLEFRGQVPELAPLADLLEHRARTQAVGRAMSERRDEPNRSLVARIAAYAPNLRS
jgi:lipid II isoglutaminyl synthase (glutamine-hydrolysing)